MKYFTLIWISFFIIIGCTSTQESVDNRIIRLEKNLKKRSLKFSHKVMTFIFITTKTNLLDTKKTVHS
jgi:uncharacterized protein YcfL